MIRSNILRREEPESMNGRNMAPVMLYTSTVSITTLIVSMKKGPISFSPHPAENRLELRSVPKAQLISQLLLFCCGYEMDKWVSIKMCQHSSSFTG